MRVSLVSLVVGLAIIGYIESLSADLYMLILRTELCRKHLGDMKAAKNKTYYFQPTKGTSLTDTVKDSDFGTYVATNKDFSIVMSEAADYYKGKRLKGSQLSCLKNGFIDVNGKYSKLFASKKILGTATSIIDDFKKEMAPYIKNASEIAYLWQSWGSAAYSSLVNFTLYMDYSANIYDYYVYDEAYSCELPVVQASEAYFSCIYLSLIQTDKKNTFITKVITSPKPESQAICSLLQALDCSQNYTRYWTLYDYTNSFPKMTIPSKKDMITYFDDLKEKAYKQSLNLKYNFTYLYARWNSSYLYTRALNIIQKDVVLGDCNFTDVIINTTQILLMGNWQLAKDNVTCILTKVNITSKITYLDSKKNSKYVQLSTVFDISKIDTKKFKSGGTYVSDKKTKLKYLFVRYTKQADSTYRFLFDDLYSMAYIEVENKRINAYIQRKNLASPVDGILISGFEDTDPVSGRRKRDDSEVHCSVQCRPNDRLTRSVEADDGSDRTFSVHHPRANVNCIEDCLETIATSD